MGEIWESFAEAWKLAVKRRLFFENCIHSTRGSVVASASPKMPEGIYVAT